MASFKSAKLKELDARELLKERFRILEAPELLAAIRERRQRQEEDENSGSADYGGYRAANERELAVLEELYERKTGEAAP